MATLDLLLRPGACSMDDLEMLKRKKLEAYMQAMQSSQQQEIEAAQQQAALEMQIKALMQKLLEPNARERLSNVKVAKPDLARQVELLILQLYQAGRIQKPLTEQQLVNLLKALSSGKREWKIKRV